MPKGQKLEQRELTPEQKALCPYGVISCPICRLKPEQIEDLHKKKYEQKMPVSKILAYLRNEIGISPSYTWISDHFNKHTRRVKHPLISKTVSPKVVEALDKSLSPIKAKKLATDTDKAFEILVTIAKEFVMKTDKVIENLPWNEEELQEEFKNLGSVESLKLIAKLHKAGREQLKDIQAIRAPKVMVAHFLEKSLDSIIYETGMILTEMSTALQAKVISASRRGLIVNKETFADIFREAGKGFVKKMTALKKEQLALAEKALKDLEKLV